MTSKCHLCAMSPGCVDFSVKIPISAKRDYFKAYRQKKVSRRKLTSIQFVSLSTSLRLAEWLGAEIQEERFDN